MENPMPLPSKNAILEAAKIVEIKVNEKIVASLKEHAEPLVEKK